MSEKSDLKKASHKAMIRHLDGTPNDELRELIEDYRADIERIQEGDYEEFLTEPQREEYIEGLATVCNALEHLINDE